MAKRVNPATDELFVKGIDELDPATELSGSDKLAVFQGASTRSAELDDVFGIFASAQDLEDLETQVNNSLSNYVTLTTDQTISGPKTFTQPVNLPPSNPTLADQATRKAYVDGLDAQNVKLTGSQTVAGTKTFSSNPLSSASQSTAANALTRKDYVDGLDAQNVKLTGAQTIAGVKTFSSNVSMSAAQGTSASNLTRKDYVDSLDAANVKLTGNQTLAGIKTFSSSPAIPDGASANDAVSKQQLDTKVTLTGNETINGVKTFGSIPELPASNPTTDNQATRKSYVDSLDATSVKTTGAQTVNGVKSFTSIPTLPASNPATDNQATRKAYVDGLDATNVKLSGNQTVAGIKTFSSSPSIPDGIFVNDAVSKQQLDTKVGLSGDETIGGTKTFSAIPLTSAVQSTAVSSLTRRDFVTTLDSANVKLTGDQAIAGVKTFGSSPTVPSGVLSADAVNRSQLDTKVTLTGNETIAGVKTFSSNPISTAAQSSATNSLTRRDFVTGLDAANVKLTGNQSISGIKTFSNSPSIPDGVLANDAVSKQQLDSKVALTGNETIAGTKTFTSNPVSTAAQSSDDGALTRRDFVTGLDSVNVKLTGTQTIAGAKTFTDDVTIEEGNQLLLKSDKYRITNNDGAGNWNFRANTYYDGGHKFQSAGVHGASIVINSDTAAPSFLFQGTTNGPSAAAGDPATYTTFFDVSDTFCRYKGNSLWHSGNDGAGSGLDADTVDGLQGSALVQTSGNQTIAGVKTFSSNPISTATQSVAVNALTRKDYVDSHINRTDNPHAVTAAQVGNTNAQWNANQLQGRSIAATAPSDGNALVWQQSSSSWIPRELEQLLKQSQDVTGSTYNVAASDANKFFRLTGGTLQLPSAATTSGLIIGVYRVNTSAVVKPASGQAVNATFADYTLTEDKEFVILRSDGNLNWAIISSFYPSLNTTIPISKGGTGASTSIQAARNLGVPFSNSEAVSSSTYTVDYLTDNGKVFRAGTGSNNVRFTLPATSTIPNGFSVSFVKNSPNNEMRINAQAGDSIGDIPGSNSPTSTNWFAVTGEYHFLTFMNIGSVWYIASNYNGVGIAA